MVYKFCVYLSTAVFSMGNQGFICAALKHEAFPTEVLHLFIIFTWTSDIKEVRHIEMPKAAPKSPFAIFKN